jgi:hypothetical protein
MRLIIAPIYLPVAATDPFIPKKGYDWLSIRTPFDQKTTNQDLIVVNPPITLIALHMPFIRDSEGTPRPRRMLILAAESFMCHVYRPDEKSLVIKPYSSLLEINSQLFRSENCFFEQHNTVEIPGMNVTITEFNEHGKPLKARFRFTVPLEHSSLRWLKFKNGEFIEFIPPDVGETVTIQW